jgi:hypothetical protein
MGLEPEARVVKQMRRRRFIGLSLGVAAGFFAGARRAWAVVPHQGGPHPTPRPGITAANVLSHDQLTSAPHAIEVFDQVREIPEIVDGIRCQCGCADNEGFYSLLSCYESEGMARFCDICQGEGRLVYRLHQAGQSLDEIRAAIDARFG